MIEILKIPAKATILNFNLTIALRLRKNEKEIGKRLNGYEKLIT